MGTKRAKYDQLGESYSQWQQGGGRGNFDEWFSQSPSYQQADYGDLNDMFGGGFSDFFNVIFSQMGGQPRPSSRQSGRSARSTPRAISQPVTISFQEAYQGAERSVEFDDRHLQVKIPAGANTGTRVRMAGVGPVGADIYLVIEVTPDPTYERKGDDLYTEVDVDLYSAVLGGQATVVTPGGIVVLTIPAGTQQDQTFRLAGRGMPRLRGAPKTYGDLYARAVVHLPRNLTPRQRELFEQLRES